MKYSSKKSILVAATLTLFMLNACSSDSSKHYDTYDNREDNHQLTTLFLVDENGYSYAGIPYICDSMEEWSQTRPNGEFSFIPPDNCRFDFYGLDGDYGYTDDEIVRIVDYANIGKEGIPYECSSFGVSSTYTDGSFDYDQNDACEFYL